MREAETLYLGIVSVSQGTQNFSYNFSLVLSPWHVSPIPFGAEDICQDDFNLIRILAACISR